MVKERGSDETLSRRVSEAIDSDPGLKGYAIKAEVRDGEAHLSGIVDVLAEKARADEIARQVAGVSRVENGITISTDGSITDADVEFEVGEELAHARKVDVKQVGAGVTGGVAHLMGRVDTLEEADAAVRAAEKARGVRGVVNELELTDFADVDDASLANRVQDALMSSDDVTSPDVRATSHGGVVRLSGGVASESERAAAAKVARGVGGVKKVIDEMDVELDQYLH